MEHYHNGIMPTDTIKLHEAHIFLRCLNVGNQELILQYEDKMYLQKRGLAMGIADSPDLANLFRMVFRTEK